MPAVVAFAEKVGVLFIRSSSRQSYVTMAKSKNGYMTFILEAKRQDQRQNINRPDSYYAQKWANLSDEEKKRYRSGGRPAGRDMQLTSGHVATAPAGAMCADDVATNDLEQDALTAEELELSDMTEVLVGDDVNAAIETKFVIGAANVMVKTIEGVYLPLELGLVKYSVREGVISHYHQFTDPGPVPMGYMHKATTHINSSHKIPLLGFDQAIGRNDRQREFQGMMDEISIFLNDCYFQYKNRSRCVIFTREDMVQQLRGSLEFYIETSGHPEWMQLWEEQRLRVADISFLIFRMYGAIGSGISLPLCADIPNITTYDYQPGSCDYHTKEDNNFCALGVCKRWCYLMSDCFLPELPDIEPVEGKHLPLSVQTAIHVEEADSDGPWNETRHSSRRSVRPFGSVNGDRGPERSVAGNNGPHAAEQANPRLEEFDDVRPKTDVRTVGGVGRGRRPL